MNIKKPEIVVISIIVLIFSSSILSSDVYAQANDNSQNSSLRASTPKNK